MKSYVCQYRHCLHPGEKIPDEDSVLVGLRHFHKDCAEMNAKINTIKKIFFDHVLEADYVQTLAVINRLIFKLNVDPDYLLFVVKHLALFSKGYIHSPYSMLTIVKSNQIIKDKWDNPYRRKGVIDAYARRFGEDR